MIKKHTEKTTDVNESVFNNNRTGNLDIEIGSKIERPKQVEVIELYDDVFVVPNPKAI